MKVPCTECKQPCKRKVVNRGTENLNRIYYKCEDCNHKVGWEDELLAGAKPWIKRPGGAPKSSPSQAVDLTQSVQHQQQPPPPLVQQQQQQSQQQVLPVQQQALPARQQQQQPQLAALKAAPRPLPPELNPKTEPNDEQDVEILFERPAPQGNTGKVRKAAANSKPGAPHALSPDSCEEVGEGAGVKVPPAQQRPPQQQQSPEDPRVKARVQARPSPHQAAAMPQAQQTAAAAAFTAAQPASQQRPSGAAAVPNGRTAAEEALQAAAASKRKFDEAFQETAARAAKRPATDAQAATGVPAPASANVFAARAISTGGSARPATAQASGHATMAASIAAAAAAASAAAAAAVEPGPAVRGGVQVSVSKGQPAGVFVGRVNIRPLQPVAASEHQGDGTTARVVGNGVGTGAAAGIATGLGASPPAPGRMPNVAPVAGGTAAGQPGQRVNYGVQLGAAAEGTDTYNPAMAARPTIRIVADNEEVLRQEIRRLRRELAVLTAQLREEQVRAQNEATSSLGLRARLEVLERENRDLRMKQQASAVRERNLTDRLSAYVARERAQQQQQQQQQAEAQARAQAQAQAQAHAQEHFFYNWFQQRNAQQQQQQQQYQQEQGQNFVPPEGGNPGASANGGGGGPWQARGAAAGTQQQQQHSRPKAASAGGGPSGPTGPTPKEPTPPPHDDAALLAFAQSATPTLDESSTVRALKQFLTEAGVSESQLRLCAEKSDLLVLARERVNRWEVRRAVACSKLSVRNVGDHALLRVPADGDKLQNASLVKASYRDLMLRLHPDKNRGDDLATPAFQYLKEAHTRLKDLYGEPPAGG